MFELDQKVSDWLTLPMQTRSAQQSSFLKLFWLITLADACTDMSALADTSAAHTTARVLCMAGWPCLPSSVTSSKWTQVYHYHVKVQVNLTYNFLFNLEQTLPNSSVRLCSCTSLMYVIKQFIRPNADETNQSKMGIKFHLRSYCLYHSYDCDYDTLLLY